MGASPHKSSAQSSGSSQSSDDQLLLCFTHSFREHRPQAHCGSCPSSFPSLNLQTPGHSAGRSNETQTFFDAKVHGSGLPAQNMCSINICRIKFAFLISRCGSWGQSVWALCDLSHMLRLKERFQGGDLALQPEQPLLLMAPSLRH